MVHHCKKWCSSAHAPDDATKTTTRLSQCTIGLRPASALLYLIGGATQHLADAAADAADAGRLDAHWHFWFLGVETFTRLPIYSMYYLAS